MNPLSEKRARQVYRERVNKPATIVRRENVPGGKTADGQPRLPERGRLAGRKVRSASTRTDYRDASHGGETRASDHLIRAANVPGVCVGIRTRQNGRRLNDRPFNYGRTRVGNQIPPKKSVAAIAGSAKFTPSPLWAEPREPEPRFLHRTKLSSRPVGRRLN